MFEGWFSSGDSLESQQASGLLSCPVCGTQKVSKKLTASRISRGRNRQPSFPDQVGASGAGPSAIAPAGRTTQHTLAEHNTGEIARLQAQIMSQIREMVRNTENVGPRFTEEAMRMHHGETAQRPIRGTATREDYEALVEEGITALPIPDYLDDDRLQ